MKILNILLLSCIVINAKQNKAIGPLPIQTQIDASQALVRVGCDIPDEEKKYALGQRRAKACLQLQELGIEIPINVAFCFSGGGDRAMLATLGSLLGAQKISNSLSSSNLLGGITYMAALSGSTWMQALWQSSGKSLTEIKSVLKNNLTKDTILANPISSLDDMQKEEFCAFINNLVTKTIFQQDVSTVDIWGALIANHIFKDLLSQHHYHMNIRLTNTQMPNVIATELPFPIYTAIEGHDNKRWFEVTPIESGFLDVGWVPTWALNRKFKEGCPKKCKFSSILRKSDYPPEQALCYFLAIFGSAYTINLREYIDTISIENLNNNQEYNTVAKFILNKLKDTALGDMHIPSAQIYNYSYKMEHSPIQHKKTFELRDAAIDFNLPLPPLLRKEREIDIIFAFDASDDILEAPALELYKAAAWAKQNNVPFQDLSLYPNLGKEAITILDQSKDAPIIIYMPLCKDKNLNYTGPAKQFDLASCIKNNCSTISFRYSEEAFEGLTALTEQNMLLNRGLIVNALQECGKRAQFNTWYL